MREPEQRPGTGQVGAGLREVRERLGWRLPDVAQGLRIRLIFLEAIERGELAALPGPAYQTGFIRSYAQALGLDADEILRRFRDSGGMGSPPRTELSFLAPVPDRALPTNGIVLMCAALVVLGYGLWYLHTTHERRLAQNIPSVPVQLAPLALPAKPPAPLKTATTSPKKPAPTPASGTKTVVVKATPAMGAPATAKPTPVAPTPALPAAAPTTKPTPGLPAAPLISGKTIVASANAWVEVQDATGNILFSKLLHAGQRWPVPDEAGLTLITGNAGGTEIIKNGKTGQPLGANGAVVTNYTLTPPAPKTAAPAPKN